VDCPICGAKQGTNCHSLRPFAGTREASYYVKTHKARVNKYFNDTYGAHSMPEQDRSSNPRKHPLRFVAEKGLLAEDLGLTQEECKPIERVVEIALEEKWNFRRLLTTVGDMEISDEVWANFLYTYGWWDGRRRD
jgi:hypothetical protein